MLDNNKIDEEIVPYFSCKKNQIIFEFFYIVVTFILPILLMILIHFKISIFSIDNNSKVLIYSAIGGFLGGWALVSKWFYRSTARGEKNQYSSKWESHKFYWRILTPFVSSLIAFTIFLLATMNVLPLTIENKESGRIAFGFSFILGYFSDIMISKLSTWIESSMKAKND